MSTLSIPYSTYLDLVDKLFDEYKRNRKIKTYYFSAYCRDTYGIKIDTPTTYLTVNLIFEENDPKQSFFLLKYSDIFK